MLINRADCPECGASVDANHYEEEQTLHCPWCDEELIFVNDDGIHPQLITPEEYELRDNFY